MNREEVLARSEIFLMEAESNLRIACLLLQQAGEDVSALRLLRADLLKMHSRGCTEAEEAASQKVVPF